MSTRSASLTLTDRSTRAMTRGRAGASFWFRSPSFMGYGWWPGRRGEDGRWRMEDGGWKMEDGRWKMEDGRWKMEDGGKRISRLLLNFKPYHQGRLNAGTKAVPIAADRNSGAL